MISAVVFTKDGDEEIIEPCLKTVAWADEVIVIEDNASPKLMVLLKKYATKIETSKTSDFAKRHNQGQELAKGDWILYVDSDERVSKELQNQITKELESPKADAYEVNRVNYFLGKKVRYGDRYPDYVTRLFKKANLKGWTGEIHESSHVEGSIGKLTGPLYHLTHTNIFSMMAKTKDYAETEAKLRLAANHPPVVGWRLVRVFVTEFFHRIFGLQGYRQGTEGWIDGIFQAFSMFIVYARLWEMQRKETLKETYKDIDKKILEEWS